MSKTIETSALVFVLGLSSSLLSGCDRAQNRDWQVCVDAQGRRIADSNCGHSGGYGGWAYINRGGSAPKIGENVRGASASPTGGVSYGAVPEGGVARGGFGGTGESAGGEGGGHGGGAGE